MSLQARAGSGADASSALGGPSPEEMMEASLPLVLEAMWRANLLDIEATLRGVCDKVGCPFVLVLQTLLQCFLLLMNSVKQFGVSFSINYMV